MFLCRIKKFRIEMRQFIRYNHHKERNRRKERKT